MKTLRCFFLGVILVISSAFALGGEIQTPGKSDPAPTPTPTALTTASTSDAIQPTSNEGIQIGWQDATTMLVEILLTIF